MWIALSAKFSQNAELKNLLLSTGDSTIIEDSFIDMYWGGAKKEAKSMLGVLLMIMRERLKKSI